MNIPLIFSKNTASQGEYCFQPDAEAKLEGWITKQQTSAFLIVGPPGIGKTTLVYRVLKKIGYTLVEFNASHTRSGIAFTKTILPLLRYGGVQEWLRDGSNKRMGVLLDEMDGLSSGEKGGLNELLKYLRAWKPEDGSHPLILICNKLQGRPMEQIKRLCTTITLEPPKAGVIQTTLSKELPNNILNCGDLRVLFRYLAGFPPLDQTVHLEESRCTSTSLEWAWYCLYGEYDPYQLIELEYNEANLAGLVLHENTPQRLREGGATEPQALADYKRIFNIIYKCDWADFWAFFYQCWHILPLNQTLKLKCPNQIFAARGDRPAVPTEAQNLVFTRVLSRQSALYNAWKEMCAVHDANDIPVRCVPMVAGAFSSLKTRALALHQTSI
jgi:hypothetical protein